MLALTQGRDWDLDVLSEIDEQLKVIEGRVQRVILNDWSPDQGKQDHYKDLVNEMIRFFHYLDVYCSGPEHPLGRHTAPNKDRILEGLLAKKFLCLGENGYDEKECSRCC